MRNSYRIRKVALRNLRNYHQKIVNEQNTVKGNEIKKLLETSLRADGNFDLMEVEKEIIYLNLLSNLNNEKEIFKEFIMHLRKCAEKEQPCGYVSR